MAITHYYVDPGAGSDLADGSIGTPWKTVQHALDNAIEGADGTQINIKAGSTDTLAAALNMTAYLAANVGPSATQPLILRGYTAVADDGGVGALSGNNAVAIWNTVNTDYVHFMDLSMGNCAGQKILSGIRVGCLIYRCTIHTTTSVAVEITNTSHVIGCYLHTLSGSYGMLSTSASLYAWNYVKAGTSASAISGSGSVAIGNILVHSSNGGGIGCNDTVGNIVVNTASGTGNGIEALLRGTAINNIVQGYSGAGGKGINVVAGCKMVGHNAFYNNTTNMSGTPVLSLAANDVALAADPFTDAANGDFSLTAAAKTALRGLGWPAAYLGAHANTDGHVTIGAVQYGEAEAGGGGMLVGNKRANKEG